MKKLKVKLPIEIILKIYKYCTNILTRLYLNQIYKLSFKIANPYENYS